MIALFLMVSAALAGDYHVVSNGETIETIAAALAPRLSMDPTALAADLRAKNGLAATAEPVIGAILNVPGGDATSDNPSMVTAVIGPGYAEGGGLAKTDLKRGVYLPAGATVCTGEGGFATIRLATAVSTPEAPTFAHDDVSLVPLTCLTVTSAFTGSGTRSSLVSLSQGGVSVRSADETPGVVTVVTPTGVTSGENGGFRVQVEANGARTEAVGDSVGVFGAGSQIDVAAGEGTRVEAGKAPDAPVALLGGVNLIAPLNDAFLRRPDFSWDPVDRAAGYQIELSTESDFSEIVAQEQVSEPVWHPDTLLVPFRVPSLYWRVASFDRSGFVGTPSLPREVRFPAGVGP